MDIDEDSTLPYLLELLSVKDSGVDQLPVGPETRVVRIIDSLKQVVIKRSEIHPLILAVEDLHWADERSKEVLKQIMESIPGARVLMIFTYRPEYIETWPGRSYHSQLTLNRLSERDNRMIASHLLGTNTLKKELEELILEKAEGVPFFVEEFIRSLKDLKVIERKDNQYILGRNASRIAVPSTIQDVIMARVDTLPEGAKEVLQLGSVIEREFSFNLLKMEMGIPEQELLSHLSVLKDVGLLFERGMHPGNTYIFKHALTRDVVYNSILDRKKNTLHAAIGNAIESLYKENIIEHYGVLAEHFIAGEIYSKGAEYSRLAATRAERAGAILDAIEYTRKRVASLECLPPTKKVEKQIIDARTVLGRYFLRKLSYKEAKQAISPIMDKAVRSAYNKRLPEILTINGTYLMNIQEDATNAFESLEKAVKIAGDSKDNAALSLSSWRLGLTRALNCEFEEAIRYFKKTLDIMTTVNNPWEISAANSYLSIWGYGFLGRIYQADIASEAAVRLSEESGDVYSKSMAYTSRGLYHYNRGFFKAATEHFSQAIEFCEKIDYAIFNALTRLFISEVCYENGDYKNLMHHHAEALELLEKYGIYRSWTDFHKLGVAKAQVMMDEGDIDLKPLYGYVKNNKVKLFDGYMKRFMGEILFKIGGEYLPEAENWIKQAIATDKKDGIMCCLARDYTILASLLKQKADDSEAKLSLAKAIRIFKDCGADGWVEKTETNMSKI